jgi:hypothetical protein
MRRPAAHVYQTPTGIGWLEPGYYDETPPPSPQWHVRDGQLIDMPDGVFLRGSGIQALIVDAERAKANPDLNAPDLQRVFEWYRQRLTDMGTTHEEQRITIAAMLSSDLS